MKIRNAQFAAVAAIALAMAGTASAQQPAAAAQSQLSGPPVPGLCFFSDRELVGTSKLGKYVMDRVGMLGQQAGAELNTTGTALDNDIKAYSAQKASLPVTDQQKKELELGQRREALQQLAQTRQQEIDITRQKALGRLGEEMNPLFDLVAKERNCSIVLSEAAVLDVAPAMDITPAIAQRLDAKITEFAFDRANLQQEIAAAQAAQGRGPGAAAQPASTAPRPAGAAAAPATRRK